MNKQQAAEFLQVSEKTVERAVKSNQLAAIYVKGKHGQTPVFEQAELERYKAERDAILHAPIIEQTAEQTALAPVQSLLQTTRDTPGDSRQTDVAGFADALADALSRRAAPLLTFRQASLAFNVSQKFLNDSIESGQLKAHKIGAGGASVLKRSDVQALIESL